MTQRPLPPVEQRAKAHMSTKKAIPEPGTLDDPGTGKWETTARKKTKGLRIGNKSYDTSWDDMNYGS